MPWRLIRDKVEIDSRFISCAEYQLFIDHLKKIGENPQPNHWKNSRFSPQSAKLSITGIKASNAEAFCYWLTQHSKTMGVKYRLPTLSEIENFPATETGIGSWCTQGNSWVVAGIGAPDWETWQTSLFQVLDTAIAYDFFRTLNGYLNQIADLDIAIILTLDQASSKIKAQQSQDSIFKALNHALIRVKEVARNLGRSLGEQQNRVEQIMRDFSQDLFLDDSILCKLLQSLATEFEENIKNEGELILDVDLALDFDQKYQGQLKNILLLAKNYAQIREKNLLILRRFFRLLKSNLASQLTDKLLKIRNFSQIINKIVELDLDLVIKLETELKQVLFSLRSQNHSRLRVLEQVIQDNGNLKEFDLAQLRYYLIIIATSWHWLSEIYIKAASSETSTNKNINKYQELSKEYLNKSEEVLHIYTAFVLLEERQNHKIPAWEGLRLVREWTN